MALSKADALRAYARMMNTLDASHIEPLLAFDFQYTSQWVFDTIASKKAFLDYIVPKLDTIAKSGNRAYAEMSEFNTFDRGPCVLMAQGDKEKLLATVLVQVENGEIKRLDMCIAPSPWNCPRSGDYPT